MISHFRLVPFLAGLVAGFLIYLVYKPEKQEIKQFPHPNDSTDKVFRDKNGTCYKYSVHEVSCDANESTMKDYPIQG